MRNVLWLSVAMLMCVALSSCATSPDKAFMGTWEGTDEEATLEVSFMEKDILIIKTPDETIAGTWTIGPEGNAVMTFEDKKVIATLLSDGKIIARSESGSSAVVFEKRGSKKK